MSIRLMIPFLIDSESLNAHQEIDRLDSLALVVEQMSWKNYEVKYDCFFHRTGNNMSALYDHCDLIKGLKYDECPCYKCNGYISNDDAIELVKKEVLKNEEEQQ